MFNAPCPLFAGNQFFSLTTGFRFFKQVASDGFKTRWVNKFRQGDLPKILRRRPEELPVILRDRIPLGPEEPGDVGEDASDGEAEEEASAQMELAEGTAPADPPATDAEVPPAATGPDSEGDDPATDEEPAAQGDAAVEDPATGSLDPGPAPGGDVDGEPDPTLH